MTKRGLSPEAQGLAPLTLMIDGQIIQVDPADKHLVSVAARARIGIPAPCSRSQQINGCCNGCVVEVNGEQKLACCTAPEDGMEVISKTPKLKALRKQRFLEHREAIKAGTPIKCCGSGSSCCEPSKEDPRRSTQRALGLLGVPCDLPPRGLK